MNLNKRIVLPVIILGGLVLLAVIIKLNPPETRQRTDFAGPQLAVEALTLEPRSYPIMLESYGTVQPRTRSMLVAQVSGQIVSVNPNVRDGGFFEKGDVLVSIDSRDYAANVRIAEASLADAQQALAEAEARTEQAREDWQRLGNTGTAPDLVLRVPQLEAAKARVRSAAASLEKAQLDLERTRIRAPFAGRVLTKFVDLGQVVGMNSQIAEIYATDVVEIRLPLRNRDLPFIDLPEAFRDSDAVANSGAAVLIQSELAGDAEWQAELVRTEGAIDETARQLHVIAKIDDPFDRKESAETPLKIGQYVTAKLQGNSVPNALVIPNQTIYQGSYVYVVEDGVLRRRDIDIAWQNDEEAIVAGGLVAGDKLVTTALGQVTSGIRVSIIGENENGQSAGGGRGAPGTATQSAPARQANGDSQ
ncbi:MAG: efflux RND transporter periplasmic adaptor subunit [Woeseia sp.]|nr:efflux RND transporter periplasmic adaptor subunit [Woeseia sp.]